MVRKQGFGLVGYERGLGVRGLRLLRPQNRVKLFKCYTSMKSDDMHSSKTSIHGSEDSGTHWRNNDMNMAEMMLTSP